MAEVGVAFVSIVPSAKGFGSALNQQTGAASAAAGTSGGKRFGGTFASSMKGLVGPALLIGLGAATAGLIKGAIGEAREAQKVGAITAQVIKTTGGAANVTAGQVGKLATALSNKTGIDDEVIQKGSNLLLTFKNVRNEVGKNNDVFNQATKAAVDLSAAGFGSVDSASKMLGKALNDPVKGMTALGRAGVTFTAGQQKQIKALVKSGDLLGAQKIILGEVKSQVGGAAEASATAGEKMKVAWSNAKESLGTALLPAIDSLQQAITTKIIPAIVSFIGFLQKNPAIVKAFAIAVAAIAAAFVVAFIAANAFIIGMGLLIAAVVLVALFIVKNWDKIKAKTAAVWNGIKSFLAGVWNGIKSKASAVWNGIKTFISNVWNGIKSKVSAAATAVVNFLKQRWENLKTNTRNALNAVVKFFRELPGKVINAVRSLTGKLKNFAQDAMRGLLRGLINGAKAVYNKAREIANKVASTIKNALKIGSPSKVFIAVGRDIGGGMAIGIDRSGNRVAAATTALANTAVGASQVGIGSRFSSRNLVPAGGGAVIPDMPIVDGSQVIGYLRDVATDRARIEIARNDRADAMAARYTR